MNAKHWDHASVAKLFAKPFLELIFEARSVHREHFPKDEIELCTLLSIKTGACPEDCGYCSQSGHFKTNVEKEKFIAKEKIMEAANKAKTDGAKRFCMGAAWRNPPQKDFPKLLDIVTEVKALGLETCMTLGMLDQEQAASLKEAGLDYYNHNLDTSPEYYSKVVTTRTYQDRLDTLEHVRNAGINVCCGGILGMGESETDRISLLLQLANLPKAPESVPINRLMGIENTPLGHSKPIDNLDYIRTIAVARMMMPTSKIRLAAGRDTMSDEMQALCFMAGANSIFLGDKLLTESNPEACQDMKLLERLGIKPSPQLSESCNSA